MPMRSPIRTTAVLCLVLLGGEVAWALPPALATAAREEARRLFLDGKAHYDAGRYARAKAAFRKAGALAPSPILDYNLARCHDRLGENAEAIRYYERYLGSAPEAAKRAEVETRLKALRSRSADPYADLENRGAASQPATQPASQPAVAAAREPLRAGPAALPPPGLPRAVGPRRLASRDFPHEATLQRERREAYFPVAPARRRRVDAPAYRQWWFWVGIGAGVAITSFIIATAATGGTASPPQRRPAGLILSF
ncbi:MAG: tetratricopeptide repeat-containing protein [Deltaproteobacteria bacterium]|nr:tetratricopeptide repeat-containing protein [Deltaproteobacteria bacterium]